MASIATPALDLAESQRLYARGRWLVIASGVVMSVSGPLVRMLESATAWQFLVYRSIAVVTVVALILVARHRGTLPAVLVAGGRTALLGGFFLALAFTGIVFALLSTTIANALFLLSTAPILTAGLAWALLGERPGRTTLAAIGIAVVGVLIMVGEGIAEGDLFGDLTALGSALSFALFSVVIRRGKTREMTPCVFYGAAFAGAFAAVLTLITGEGLAVSGHDVAVSFAYGAVGISGGLVLYTLGSKHVPAAELNLLSLGEVVLAPLWVWMLFAEVPSALTLTGGLVLLLALAVQAQAGDGTIRRRRREPPAWMAHAAIAGGALMLACAVFLTE